MKPGLRTKSSHRLFLISSLFVAMLLTACGTLQVDLAPTPGSSPRPGVPITPTPWFGPAQFETEAGVIFDDRLKLLGYTVKQDSSKPGSRVTVTLIWEVLDKIDADYNTFVHLFNEEDQLLAQSDRPTGGGYRESPDWIIKEYVYDQHHLQLPAGIALKDVEVLVGLYDAGEGRRVDVESPNTYTIQEAATPTPEGQAAAESDAGPTETAQSKDSDRVDPLQTPADTTPEILAPEAAETPEVEVAGAGSGQEPLELRAAYVNNGDVWIWEKSSRPQQLTLGGGVESVWLSDDGQYIAFTRDQDIWVVDSDGGNERRLTHQDDFQDSNLDPEMAPYVTGIVPMNVAWRPDSDELYFNTSPQMEGPGLLLSDDLWRVDADTGELSMALAPGEGGNFYFSPDGRSLAIVTPGRIDLMAADGSGRREAFTHTPVITFSEFEYYAEPVWAPDSDSLKVAIPPADSSAVSSQPMSIWHIPVEDRPPWLAGQVIALRALHYPPLFAPNLARLAYLTEDNPENIPESNLLDMAVAELSESKVWDPVIYPAEVMNVHGWSPDGMRLLITLPTALLAEITMGQPDIKPLISDGDVGSISHLTWTDDFRFLYVRYNEDGWKFLLGHVDGSEPVLIDSGTSSPVYYDFAWVPAETAESQN